MAEVGTGIQISFQSGFLGEIINIEDNDQQRPEVDVTHQLSGQREYLPGKIPDWGRLECEIAFDATKKPPLTQAAETVEITYPDGSKWSRTGFMSGFRVNAQLEERITANARIKFTGDVTVTPPA